MQKPGAPSKLHLIKTNLSNAGLIHTSCYAELFSGRVRLLTDTKVARQKLLSTKAGQRMGPVERDRMLEPYNNTQLLIDETSNIRIKKQNISFSVEMIDGSKEKDTFSALEYGLYYITQLEKKYYAKRRKRTTKWASAMQFN